MSPEETIAAARKADHIVIVHKGQVFFNAFDEKEADRWAKLGANLIPFYDDTELAHFKKRGRFVKQGWEVHLLGACEPVYIEDADGDQLIVTHDRLLAAARG